MSGTDLSIRHVTPADGPAFFALRRSAILHGCAAHYARELIEAWTTPSAEERLHEPIDEHFYAGFEGLTMVVCGLLDLEDARIDALFVVADRQGQGLGALMLEHLEDIARAVKIKELRLNATLNAAAFYRTRGYSGHGVVEVASRGVHIRSVSMRKSLPA